MRNTPTGIWTCGMPSMAEIRKVTVSSIGGIAGATTSKVGGMTAAVGSMAGTVVDVDSMIGTSVISDPHAERAKMIIKWKMTYLFMVILINAK
jgi:hypothetical protein